MSCMLFCSQRKKVKKYTRHQFPIVLNLPPYWTGCASSCRSAVQNNPLKREGVCVQEFISMSLEDEVLKLGKKLEKMISSDTAVSI